MAYLSAIIDAVEAHFKLEVMGKPACSTEIDGVRFAVKEEAYDEQQDPSILYLADYGSCRPGELSGNILYTGCPKDATPEASMYIRGDIDPAALYNVISDRLMQDRKLRRIGEALFLNLYAGNGISGLLKTAYGALGNPILVLDNVFSTLAFYPNAEGPFWESSSGTRMLDSRVMSSMQNQNMFERIRHSVYPFRIYVEDLGFELIFASIRIQRAVVGHICIRCRNRRIEDCELSYIHLLSQMISIQLHQNDSYQNPHGIKYEFFLKYLFTNRFDTEETARRHLSFLNVQPKNNYYLVASKFCTEEARRMANDYYCRQFSNLFANSITGVMGERFITLISTEDAAFFSPELLKQFEAFLTMNKMKAAVSYMFDALLNAREFLEQCTSQLNYLIVTDSVCPVGFYCDHYIRHLAEMFGSYEMLKTVVHPAILRMEGYDNEHRTNYLKTLVTYFKCSRSAPATAKALFIHKSTLFYRFEKMSSLFGIDFEDADALFAYEFSLHLTEILSGRRHADT